MAEFDGEKMKITYDLIYNNPNQKFTVTAYGSFNDFVTKLENVIGDVGNNVLPGEGKIITWYLAAELPLNFNDMLQVKLVATPMAGGEKTEKRMQFVNPNASTTGKKGKSMNISWEGVDPAGNYMLELFSGKDKKTDIATVGKNLNFKWKVPKNLEKGVSYKIKLTNRENSMDYIFSPEFTVKSGISPLLIVAPAIVVGSVAYLVFGSGGGGGPGGNTELNDLPPPIDPQ
jgi:hypothetical protein